MALMQPRMQAVDGRVPHAMDMPETKWESGPTGVQTNDPGPLTKAFTNYSSTGHASIAQSKFKNRLRTYRGSGVRHS